MGNLSRIQVPYIGFPSSYIIRYSTDVKFDFPLIASIYVLRLCRNVFRG